MGISAEIDHQTFSFPPIAPARLPGEEAVFSAVLQRKVLALGALPIFEGAREADLRRLADSVMLRRLERGRTLMRMDAGDDCVFLLEGRARMTVPRGAASGELSLGLFEAGDLIGGSCWVHRGAYAAGETVTLETCVAAFVPRRAFDPFLMRHPVIALRLVETLATRLGRVMELAAQNSCFEVADRLYRRLSELSALRGCQQRDGSVTIRHGLRQSELAASIGASRESVNRQFAAWKSQGLIESRRNVVQVKNLRALSMSVSEAAREAKFRTASTEQD